MGKFLLRFFISSSFIILTFILYLSYFGLETDKFDALIKEKANKVNQNIKLQFNKTKIHLNPTELNLTVKLNEPRVIIKNNQINLSKLNLFLSIKSFFSSSFLLERAEIAFTKNHIKDLTKITNIFVPKIINKQIDKIFAEGQIEGEFIIPFDLEGNIRDDYGFSGRMLNASINITKDFQIKNLSSEINHTKDKTSNLFNIVIKEGFLAGFDLTESKFKLSRKNNATEVKSLLRTKGNFDFNKIKKITSLFNFSINNIKDAKGKVNLITNIDNCKNCNLLYIL